MSAQAKPNEPSMEEILASIRRIIADDQGNPVTAPEAPAALPPVALVAPVPAPQSPAAEDDVLDLGREASRVSEPRAPLPVPPVDDVDFLDPVPEPPAREPEPVMTPPPVVAAAPPMPAGLRSMFPAPPPAAPEPSLDMAALLSDQTQAAVANAFGSLTHTVLSSNARTLEDLVKDMLKPMLKTWLDDNLPSLVERLVRAEIERVARGGRR